jgi:hypothetical protein
VRKTIATTSRAGVVAFTSGLIQNHFHGWELGRAVWADAALLGVSAVAAAVTWNPVWNGVSRGPKLRAGEVRDFYRVAHGSRGGAADLQVVYANVGNQRNSGGDRTTAHNAEVWMEAYDLAGTRLASAKGNWLDMSAGRPVPVWLKTVVFKPTPEEFGLEIAGKFTWGDTAWLAGEADPPSLPPGEYEVRASVSYDGGKVRSFAWRVTNPGANGLLTAVAV